MKQKLKSGRARANVALRALLAVLAMGFAACAGSASRAVQPDGASGVGSTSFQFIAFGDAPYNEDEERQLDRLIDQVNTDSGAVFVIHVGDIKGGEEPCTDDLLLRRKVQLQRFRLPLLYTPGDNEWTDCHRTRAGQFNPVERLDHLRGMFFNDIDTGGNRRVKSLQLATQAADPAHHRFVENWMLRYREVLFVGVHVVGSENNLAPWSGLDPDDSRARPRADRLAEYRAREAAAVSWINQAFGRARSEGARAVVLAMQANLRLDLDPGDKKRRGFDQVVQAVRDGVATFDGEVLLVHGDFHRYQVDRPWSGERDPRLARFSRVQVFGSPVVRAVRITFDPSTTPLLRAEPFPPQ